MCLVLYKILMFGVMIGLVCSVPAPPKVVPTEEGAAGPTPLGGGGDLDTANTFGIGFALGYPYGGYGYGLGSYGYGYRSPYWGYGGRGYYGGYGGYYW